VKIVRHRLRGDVFQRSTSGSLEPKRVIFLSVEGCRTERRYFDGLSSALSDGLLGYPRDVTLSVLPRKDSNSDPGSVIGLLEEFIERSPIYSELASWNEMAAVREINEPHVLEKDFMGAPSTDRGRGYKDVFAIRNHRG